MHICILLLDHISQISSEKATSHLLVNCWKPDTDMSLICVSFFTRFKMIYATSVQLVLSVQTTYKLKLLSFMISHLLWKSNGKPTCRELKRHSIKMHHLLNRRDASSQRILSNGKVPISTIKLLSSIESWNTPTNTFHIWFILQQDKGRIMLKTMEYCSKFSIGTCKKPCRSHQFSHKVTNNLKLFV